MDFNGDLLNRCGKTYQRAFLSWITGIVRYLRCSLAYLIKHYFFCAGDPVFKEGDEQIMMANPVWLFL